MTQENQQLFSEIDSNARNCSLLPTKKQIDASNYKKGHINLHGLRISIENPQNSFRRGVDSDGSEWESRMNSHYGDIVGTSGADGDPLDVFIGFYPESKKVFVVNQVHSNNRDFDEHKIMLGFPDIESAKSAYLMSYERGWNGLGSIVPATIDQTKWWAFNGNTKIPLEKSALPPSRNTTMITDIEWSLDTGLPLNTTIEAILDSIEKSDDGELLLEPLLLSDFEAEGVALTLDGIIAKMNTIKVKMSGMKRSMNAIASEIKVTDVTVSDPFKRMGTAQVRVEFKLSDGQSIWAFFHNPDLHPAKIEKDDELISWKWMLNKRDVTIIAAPESGKEVAPKAIAQRLMALADKNTKSFARNMEKTAKKAAYITELRDTLIPTAEKELAQLSKKIEQAEFNKSEDEIKAVEQDQEQRYKDYTIDDLPNLKLNQLRKLARIKFGVKTLGRVKRIGAENKVRELFANSIGTDEESLDNRQAVKDTFPDAVEAVLSTADTEQNNFKKEIEELSKIEDADGLWMGFNSLLDSMTEQGVYEDFKDNEKLIGISNKITKLQAKVFSALME